MRLGETRTVAPPGSGVPEVRIEIPRKGGVPRPTSLPWQRDPWPLGPPVPDYRRPVEPPGGTPVAPAFEEPSNLPDRAPGAPDAPPSTPGAPTGGAEPEIARKRPGGPAGSTGEIVEHAGYTYGKDASGRLVKARGRLRLEEGPGYSKDVSEAVRAHGAAGDDAGHVIAKRFGADFNLDTAVPQNANLNRGQYRAMENELANHIKAGRTVDVEVEISYPGASTRPDGFTVRATVDGRIQKWVFQNTPGGR